MAIFNTFKASIETQVQGDLIKKGEAFNFNPNNPWAAEFIIQNITSEIFEFSKEDVIFSTAQIKKYKDYLKLNPFAGGLLADGVKYKLDRTHKKGEIVYIIDIDGDKAQLKLDWLNKQKIEWVHGRKINWTKWQVAAAFTAAAVAATVGYFIYNKPIPKQPTEEALPKNNTNQLPARGVDTTKKSDKIKTLKVALDTTRH